MTDSAAATDVAVDPHVVRRIRESECSLFAAHQPLVGFVIAGITTDEPMIPQDPEIARLTNRRTGQGIGDFIFGTRRVAGSLLRVLQNDVDRARFEPSEFDVEIDIDKSLQLNGQKL